MKEYVLIHTRRIDEDGAFDDVLLVLKDKPAWQAGRLNLLGGKLERLETPIEAALRELKEESGLEPWEHQPKLYCGKILGIDCIIHCIRLDVDPYTSNNIQPRAGETEKVEWFTFKEAWADDRLMPNLKVIVPLMHLGVTDWILIDQSSSNDIHGVMLQLPLKKPFENG